MYNTSFIKKILLAVTVVFLYSCDKDFNAIGDDLIGDDHFGLESQKYDVLAYNQEVTPIQSNALTNNLIGIYDNPVFGSTTANFVTQLSLETYAPTIGESPVIESVVLSIPYFSHVKSVNTDGSSVYQLDSIYDPTEGKTGKIKLSVYESGMQMRKSFFSNNTELSQLYYTHQNADFEAVKVGTRLNDAANASENDNFFFDSKEIVTVTIDPDTKKETTNRSKPEMHLNLNKDFGNKILNAPASKLSAADLFQEYIRGLYFKVERAADNSTSNMAAMDFSLGKITIKYKAKTAITTDPDTTVEDKTLVLNLKEATTAAATANFLQDVKDPIYQSVLTSYNKTQGDSRLYVKGGQGSLAVINLDNFASKLEEIRTNKWLVNEANLVFYLDSDLMKNAFVPKRVYLYDLTNNTILVDYNSDTSSLTDPKASKVVFGGIMSTDSKGVKSYKIRLTNHIRNLIKDKTYKNVQLGLVVTESIGIIASNLLFQKNDNISQAPRASVMNPFGTILYGTNIPASDPNYAKRLQLEVYYTKPN